MVPSFALQTSAVALAMCASSAVSAAQQSEISAPYFSVPRFDAPVELTADGKPMRGIYYPSPTMFDIDGDQRRELVVGDLIGYVRVAQPGKGGDDLAWGELSFLDSKSGKRIKLNNW